MNFEDLGLAPELLRAIDAQGYKEPTPIQVQAIPEVLKGRDILAGAQTGTGKTAAFTLPLLQLLDQGGEKQRHPRCLVITPTRELAAQIAESVATYGKHMSLRHTVVFGGVGINPQIDRLRRGVDILVATPGRLLDLANQRALSLKHVEILVLDEADRMLDMGFIHDIRKVLALLPDRRQNLLFSATYSQEIRNLTEKLLHNPAIIEVARRNMATDTVTQVVHRVNRKRKRELLSLLIKQGDWHQVLIFTRTKHGANRLAKQLESDGISAAAIHGNKSQTARTRALADFKANSIQALVATDIAARGLDIDRLPHVVNYELPNVPEDYVHRIGRTGRAGEEGEAVSLVSGDEVRLLKDIERLLKKQLPLETMEGFHPTAAEDKEDYEDAKKKTQERNSRGGGRGRGRNQSQGRSSNSRSGGGGGKSKSGARGKSGSKSQGQGQGQNRGQSQSQSQGQSQSQSQSRGRSSSGGGNRADNFGNR